MNICQSDCLCCKRSLRVPVETVTLENGVLTLEVERKFVDSVQDCQSICFLIETNLPCGYINSRLQIKSGNQEVPVVTKSGRHFRVSTDEVFNILKTRFFSDPDRLVFSGLSTIKQC